MASKVTRTQSDKVNKTKEPTASPVSIFEQPLLTERRELIISARQQVAQNRCRAYHALLAGRRPHTT